MRSENVDFPVPFSPSIITRPSGSMGESNLYLSPEYINLRIASRPMLILQSAHRGHQELRGDLHSEVLGRLFGDGECADARDRTARCRRARGKSAIHGDTI